MIRISRVPIVTLLLLAANLLAAYVLLLNPATVFDLGFSPSAPRLDHAFYSLFLHANAIHLLGNLVFIAAVGAAVELATGSLRFIAAYLSGGLGGVLLHWAIIAPAESPPPLIGASGCIAGCAAYYSVRYQGMRVPLIPSVSVSVAMVTGVWLFLQVLGAFVRIGDSGGGTSFWAHLGGFAAGVALSLVFRAPDLGQVRLGHEVLERMNERSPGAGALAARLHLRWHPKDPHALRNLVDACNMQDDPDGEASAIVKLLDLAEQSDHPELLWRLVETDRILRVPVLRRLMLADKFAVEDPDLARSLISSILLGDAGEPRRPDALLAMASLDIERKPELARQALNELLERYPLHPNVEIARQRGWIG